MDGHDCHGDQGIDGDPGHRQDAPPDKVALAVSATESKSLFGFMAAVFRNEIDAPLLRIMKTKIFDELISNAGLAFDRASISGPEDKVLEELAVEFAALFVGPGGHLSPHESVQSSDGNGMLWGPLTATVKTFMEKAGFQHAADFEGLPDHIGVELEFMEKLAAREAVAWQDGKYREAIQCLEIADDFLTQHLGTWGIDFFREVAKVAEHPLYRNISLLAAQMLKEEIEEIRTRRARAAANY